MGILILSEESTTGPTYQKLLDKLQRRMQKVESNYFDYGAENYRLVV
jgi:hypothetical protein